MGGCACANGPLARLMRMPLVRVRFSGETKGRRCQRDWSGAPVLMQKPPSGKCDDLPGRAFLRGKSTAAIQPVHPDVRHVPLIFPYTEDVVLTNLVDPNVRWERQGYNPSPRRIEHVPFGEGLPSLDPEISRRVEPEHLVRRIGICGGLSRWSERQVLLPHGDGFPRTSDDPPEDAIPSEDLEIVGLSPAVDEIFSRRE